MHKKSEVDAKTEQEIIDKNFKIQILEQRAVRFESTSLSKYEEMDRKLHEDTRLAALHRHNK